jgi:hypothetical protein
METISLMLRNGALNNVALSEEPKLVTLYVKETELNPAGIVHI